MSEATDDRRKNMIKNFIPEGVSDLNNDEYEKIRSVEDKLTAVFREDGYRQIMTPTFEYYDLFADDTIFSDTDEIYKLTDKSGKLSLSL